MSKHRTTLGRPSRICAMVGFGLALIGSFLLGIVLGTAYGFGLFLHLVLAGIAGYLLAMKCTENDDELFGIVSFFYTPQARERITQAAGRLTDTAKAQAERVAGAAKRLPEQVTGTGASQDEAPARRTDVTGQAIAPAAPPPDEPLPAQAPPPGTESDTEPPAGHKPPLLDAPRGDPDDLSRISGIGPKLAAMLNEVGVWHFAQIATWTDDELAWIDSHLGAFRGRARRDDWVGQARALAAGDGAAAPAQRPEPESGPADHG